MCNCFSKHKLCQKLGLQQNGANAILEHTSNPVLPDYVNKQKLDAFKKEIILIFSKKIQGTKTSMSTGKNSKKEAI